MLAPDQRGGVGGGGRGGEEGRGGRWAEVGGLALLWQSQVGFIGQASGVNNNHRSCLEKQPPRHRDVLLEGLNLANPFSLVLCICQRPFVWPSGKGNHVTDSERAVLLSCVLTKFQDTTCKQEKGKKQNMSNQSANLALHPEITCGQ